MQNSFFCNFAIVQYPNWIHELIDEDTCSIDSFVEKSYQFHHKKPIEWQSNVEISLSLNFWMQTHRINVNHRISTIKFHILNNIFFYIPPEVKWNVILQRNNGIKYRLISTMYLKWMDITLEKLFHSMSRLMLFIFFFFSLSLAHQIKICYVYKSIILIVSFALRPNVIINNL